MDESYEYKKHTITLMPDDCPESPREWDNLGTFVAFHKRENHGDTDHGYKSENYGDWDDLLKGIEEDHGPVIYHNVYMYSHSGSTVSTSPFSCQWDSGPLGIIFVPKKQVREEYKWAKITKEREETILGYLQGEIDMYDTWLRGDIWGYKVEKGEEEIDSCWGFYGQDAAKAEAEGRVDTSEPALCA